MGKEKQKNYHKVIAELRSSLAWMDIVLSDIKDGIIVFDDDLKVIFANDASAKLLGKRRINLMGRLIWEVLELTNGEVIKENCYRKALREKNFESLSGRYRLKASESKAEVDVYVSFATSLDQAVIIVHDITEQIKSEQALMDERIARVRERVERRKADEDRRLFQNIIDGTLAIIYLKDIEGRYELVNRQFEETFGVHNTEVKGKTDSELFSDEMAATLHKDDERIVKEKATIRSEESIRFENETHHYLYLKYPLQNQEGEPVGICGVLTDITNRKKLEEDKNDFIRMVYHELNTPLSVMKLFLKSTQKNIAGADRDEILNDLSKIEDQLEQMEKLTDDLLDVTKMEKAELKFDKEVFNLTELMQETIENEQTKTKKHNIRLLGNPKPYTILADKQRIGQVMHNLLSNAVKYSPEGGEVNIRIKEDSNHITVSVQDFGIGIPQEQQKNIFGRFNRGSLRNSDFSGLGMGLYIVSEIIERHGGTLDVESEEGKGSTFSFTLPV